MNALETRMTTVKLDASFNELNQFTITYRQGVLKGEKFDREKSEVYFTSTYNLSELPVKIFIDCDSSRHGIKQKMCDNLAMTTDDKAATTIASAIEAEDVLWQQLVDGNWRAVSKATKAPAIKLTDLEAKFLSGVTAGITTHEQAAELYFSITGKVLPVI